MAIAITKRDRIPYVLKRERELPSEERTTFWIRPLTALQRAKLEDESVDAEIDLDNADEPVKTVRTRSGTMTYRTLQCGLVGWDNFRDPDDEGDVPFETDGPTNVAGSRIDPPKRSTLDRIHPDDFEELARAISSAQRISDAEGKD